MIEELNEFRKFKEDYKFVQKEIISKDGILFCDDYPLLDEEGKMIGLCDKWLNVGYNHKGAYAKVLSNLFPYDFEFRGFKIGSIEAFFQGIKFKDSKMQEYVFKYSGKESNYVKACSDYNWKDTGIIYFQGKEIDRYSKEYADLVDELYVCAIQNPLYRSALLNCKVDIIHSIGDIDKSNTVFTRYEFEKELNCLKDYLQSKEL